jgi:hypothetical protein
MNRVEKVLRLGQLIEPKGLSLEDISAVPTIGGVPDRAYEERHTISTSQTEAVQWTQGQGPKTVKVSVPLNDRWDALTGLEVSVECGGKINTKIDSVDLVCDGKFVSNTPDVRSLFSPHAPLLFVSLAKEVTISLNIHLVVGNDSAAPWFYASPSQNYDVHVRVKQEVGNIKARVAEKLHDLDNGTRAFHLTYMGGTTWVYQKGVLCKHGQ